MRLDHLLSKGREEVGVLDTVVSLRERPGESGGEGEDKGKDSGADALMGNTRAHAEHDG